MNAMSPNGISFGTPPSTAAGAKLIEVVDSIARKALTSAQVNVGDIVREIGQTPIFTVSGAGSSVANGEYLPFLVEGEDVDGSKPTYSKADFSCYIFFSLYSGSWVISPDADSGASLYFDSNYGQTLADAAWDQSDGDSPAPTFAVTRPEIDPGGTYIVLDVTELSSDDGWQALNAQKSFAQLNWDYVGGETVFGGAWAELVSFDVVDPASEESSVVSIDGNKITINKTGLYLVSAFLTYSSSNPVMQETDCFCAVGLYINGEISYPTSFIPQTYDGNFPSEDAARVNCSIPIKFQAGDVLDLRLFGTFTETTLTNLVLRGDMRQCWSILEL